MSGIARLWGGGSNMLTGAEKMNEQYEEYQRWLKCATADAELLDELRAMDGAAVEDAFYRNLSFGTGGLRGVIGAGTNRMNVYTVAKASQGLANYVLKTTAPSERRIAVSFDSRIKSELFARVACRVFSANGIHACLFSQLMPTPCLSYATRALRCAAGVMVTASHNPCKYNGYKVYGADGCQITTEMASAVLREIEKLDIFAHVRQIPYEEGRARGLISAIPEAVITDYIEAVKRQSVLGGQAVDRDARIVYSPLNGTGRMPVLRALRESGFSNITVVAEQEKPDGRFPTCPYPNPEVREAMSLGIEYATRLSADLLLATDPDCDRVGIAVRDARGGYTLLSGNETGVLLLDFLCARRLANGTMPPHPVMVKTIVTTDMAQRVASHYGVETVNVLTGFKFIGEQIGLLEKAGREADYLFGMEESYGYLSGGYVRDKDAVNASLLICEMFAWYKSKGVSLLERLEALYREYGYCLNTLHSYAFEGAAGFERMQGIMARLRKGLSSLGPRAVLRCVDYAQGVGGLPRSDVLKFFLSDDCSVVVRPSGTEPKLKAYITVTAKTRDLAKPVEKEISDALESLFEA